MKKELKFELKRKFIHLFSLLFIIIYIFANKSYGKQIALISLIVILIVFLIIEYFRLVKKRRIPIVNILFRVGEENKLAGHIYFIIGTIIAFGVFDFRIALAALLMTTFGDMAAALVGIQFGKHWLRKDCAWEGIIAEFVVNVIIGIIILSNWWIIFAIAITATFVETVFTHVDDNIGIPVFAGFVGQVLSMVL